MREILADCPALIAEGPTRSSITSTGRPTSIVNALDNVLGRVCKLRESAYTVRYGNSTRFNRPTVGAPGAATPTGKTGYGTSRRSASTDCEWHPVAQAHRRP